MRAFIFQVIMTGLVLGVLGSLYIAFTTPGYHPQ